MKRYLNKIVSVILVHSWLICVVNPFLASTTLAKTNHMSLYLLIVIVLFVFIGKWYIAYPLVIFSTGALFNALFHTTGGSNIKWVLNFVRNRTKLGADYLSNETAVILFVCFILINLVLIIRKKRWKLSFVVMFTYVLALVAVNQYSIKRDVSLFLLMTFVVAYWLNHLNARKPLKVVELVSVGVILSLVFVNAQTFQTNFNQTHLMIQSKTRTLRNNLSDYGFYEIQEVGKSAGIHGKSGFSEHDNSIGGPITKNDELVFEVVQSRKRNWRIETKEIYTGSGWETNQEEGDGFNLPKSTVSDSVQYKSSSEEIVFVWSEFGMRYLPIPFGKVAIKGVDGFQIENATYTSSTQRIKTAPLIQNALAKMVYSVNDPEYTIEDLMSNASITDPRNEIDYLQLPQNLPIEIEELARRIIGDETNDYLKVKKIEDFLHSNNGTLNIDNKPFRYSLSGGGYTPNNRDFVDYFLFDSRIGYCEHFSTTMVVMLRSVGIHTRWVKGYASGTIQNKGGRETYRITGDDAHAWPEVYFENVGWVAFEPTPGFYNVIDSNQETDTSSTQNNIPSVSNPIENTNEGANTLKEDHVPLVEGTKNSTTKHIGKIIKTLLSSIAALLIVFAMLFYFFGKDIRFKVWRYRLNGNGTLRFNKTYQSLLYQLNRIIKRQDSQTIREYALSLNDLYENEVAALISLSECYEINIYGSRGDSDVSDDERKLFTSLAQFIAMKLRAEKHFKK